MGNALSTLNTSAIETRPTLDPATDRQVFDALEPMLLAYHTDADKLGAKTITLYVMAVRGEPLWAVKAAIGRIVSGTASDINRNYLPRVPAFAEEVRRQSATMRDRQDRQDKIANEQRRLDAEYEADLAAKRTPLSPEARAKVNAFISKSARSM